MPLRLRSLLLLLWLILTPAGARLPHRLLAQTVPLGAPRRFGTSPLDFGLADQSMDAHRLVVLNHERQKRLASDTDTILKLAHELEEENRQSDSAEWTPQQLRKLAEIEKLARSVRERMVYAPMPILAPVRQSGFEH